MAVIDSRLRNYVPSGNPRVVTQSQMLSPQNNLKSPFLGMEPIHKKPGGWKGFIAAAFENPILKYGLLKPLEVLDTGRRAIISGVREVADVLDSDPNTKASFGDWAKQTRDTSFGFGKAFPMGGWLGRAVGFIGDVGLDPLTYASFGGHAVLKGIEGGDKAIMAAGREGRNALARRVYKIARAAGEDELMAGAKAARVAKEGVSGARAVMTTAQQAEAGLGKAGVYFFGKRINAIRVPLTGPLGELAESASTRMRLMAASTKPGGWLQKVTTKGNEEMRAMQLALSRGDVPKEKAFRYLSMLSAGDAKRAAMGAAGVTANDRVATALLESGIAHDPSLRTSLHEVIEEPAKYAAAAPEVKQAADAWKKALADFHAEGGAALSEVDPSARVKPLENYFPHQPSEAAWEYLNKGGDKAAQVADALGIKEMNPESFMHSRRLVPGSTFFDTELKIGDLTVGRLNEIARKGGFVGDFFETDVAKVMDRYSKSWVEQMGTVAAHKHLLDDGVLSEVEKEAVFDKGVIKAAADDHMKVLAAHVEATDRVVSSSRAAADALVNFGNTVQKAWMDTSGTVLERRATIGAARDGLEAAQEQTRSAALAFRKQSELIDNLDSAYPEVAKMVRQESDRILNEMDGLISAIEEQKNAALQVGADAKESLKQATDASARASQSIKAAVEGRQRFFEMQDWFGQQLDSLKNGVKPKLERGYGGFSAQLDALAYAVGPTKRAAESTSRYFSAEKGSLGQWLDQSVKAGREAGATDTQKFISDLFGEDVKLSVFESMSLDKIREGADQTFAAHGTLGGTHTYAAMEVAAVVKHYGGIENIPEALRPLFDDTVAAVKTMQKLDAFERTVAEAPRRAPEWYAKQLEKWTALSEDLGSAYDEYTGTLGSIYDMVQERDVLREQLASGTIAEKVHARSRLARVENELTKARWKTRSLAEKTWTLSDGSVVSTAEAVTSDAFESSIGYAADRAANRLAVDAANGWASSADIERRMKLIDDLREAQTATQPVHGPARPSGELKVSDQFGVKDAPAVAQKADSIGNNIEGATVRDAAKRAQGARTEGYVTQTLAEKTATGANVTRTVKARVPILGANADEMRAELTRTIEEFQTTNEVIRQWQMLTDTFLKADMAPSEEMLNGVVDSVRKGRFDHWDAKVGKATDAMVAYEDVYPKLRERLDSMFSNGNTLSTTATPKDYAAAAEELASAVGAADDNFASYALKRQRELNKAIRSTDPAVSAGAKAEKKQLEEKIVEWFKANNPTFKGRSTAKLRQEALLTAGVDVHDALSFQRFADSVKESLDQELRYSRTARERMRRLLGDPDATFNPEAGIGFNTLQDTPTVKVAVYEAQAKHYEDQLARLQANQAAGMDLQKQIEANQRLMKNPARRAETIYNRVQKLNDHVAALKATDAYVEAARYQSMHEMLDTLSHVEGWRITAKQWQKLGLSPLPSFDQKAERELAQVFKTVKEPLFVEDASVRGGYRQVMNPMDVETGRSLFTSMPGGSRWVPAENIEATTKAGTLRPGYRKTPMVQEGNALVDKGGFEKLVTDPPTFTEVYKDARRETLTTAFSEEEWRALFTDPRKAKEAAKEAKAVLAVEGPQLRELQGVRNRILQRGGGFDPELVALGEQIKTKLALVAEAEKTITMHDPLIMSSAWDKAGQMFGRTGGDIERVRTALRNHRLTNPGIEADNAVGEALRSELWAKFERSAAGKYMSKIDSATDKITEELSAITPSRETLDRLRSNALVSANNERDLVDQALAAYPESQGGLQQVVAATAEGNIRDRGGLQQQYKMVAGENGPATMRRQIREAGASRDAALAGVEQNRPLIGTTLDKQAGNVRHLDPLTPGVVKDRYLNAQGRRVTAEMEKSRLRPIVAQAKGDAAAYSAMEKEGWALLKKELDAVDQRGKTLTDALDKVVKGEKGKLKERQWMYDGAVTAESRAQAAYDQVMSVGPDLATSEAHQALLESNYKWVQSVLSGDQRILRQTGISDVEKAVKKGEKAQALLDKGYRVVKKTGKKAKGTTQQELTDVEREALQATVERGKQAAQRLTPASDLEAMSLNRAYEQLTKGQFPTGPEGDALKATLQSALNAESELYRSGQALKASEEALYNANYMAMSFEPMLKEGFKSLESWGLPGLQADAWVKEVYDNFSRVSQPAFAEEMGKFLGWYTKRFKAYATASPGFHVRNALSNTFSALSAGADIRNMVDAEKMFQSWLSHRAAGTLDIFDAQLGERAGVFNDALRIYHAAGGGQQMEALSEVLNGKGNIIDNNLWLRGNRKAAERIEGSARFMLAYDSVVKKMDFEMGTARVRRYLFDYAPEARTQLDQSLAQIVPFWTWMSRNLPLQIVNRWTNPRAYAIYNSLMRNIAAGDNSGAPEWMQQQGAVNLGKGNYLMPDVGFNRLNEQFAMLGDPMRMLSDVNPLLRVPLEVQGNRRFYNDLPFSQRPQEVAGGPLSPAVEALLGILGKTNKVTEGGQGLPIGATTTSAASNYALMNTLPPLSLLERLFPHTGQYQERQGNSWNGFLGLPIRNVPGNG